jgi:HK97 family phage major capsid protein
MSKTPKELIQEFEQNQARINEIADACERENRSRTSAEDTEYKNILQRNDVLRMRMQTVALSQHGNNSNELNQREAERIVRDNVAKGVPTTIVICRDLVMVANAKNGGIVPVKVQDIIDPLVEGLILDKVGLPMPTGLAGDYVWPVYEAVDASVMGEAVALTDTEISLTKLTASPQRIGIAIPVTRQTINQTEGVIEMIVKKLMPLAVAKLINKIMFSTTKVTDETTLAGPFVELKASAQAIGTEPTFRDFNEMKAAVLKEGVDGTAMCWVMTQAQKAIAEATPKDAGSGIMVCENDKIAGLPVFCTNYIGEYIGLGDWRYQPLGLFGDISFVIDPYSQARKDAVDFVLNTNYGTVTLQKKAFKLAKVAAKG